ncbi:MAG: ABC transporter permease [Halobacteriales archaeon]|nr:ABC transporter permease [Halobacteriales archaeon]
MMGDPRHAQPLRRSTLRLPRPDRAWWKHLGAGVLFLLLLFGGWEALARMGFWPRYLVPAFTDVLRALWGTAQSGGLVAGLAASVMRLVLGYGIGLVLGLGLGLWMGRSRIAESTLGSVALGLQALPSVAWLPLALIWFGLSETAITFVVVMGTVFAIAVATSTAIHQTPHTWERAARNLGARGHALLLHLTLPAALPGIAMGMKQGWSFAWRSLIAAEMVYSTVGLGHLLMFGRELNDLPLVMAVMLVIVAVGLAADRLAFGRLEVAVQRRWGVGRRDAKLPA